MTVDRVAGTEYQGVALAGQVIGTASGIGSAGFQSILRGAHESLDPEGAAGAGGVDEGGVVGMALLAVVATRVIGLVTGRAAGDAARGRAEGSGGRCAVTGIAGRRGGIGGRTPGRGFLLEVTVDVGAGCVGQIRDRGLCA